MPIVKLMRLKSAHVAIVIAVAVFVRNLVDGKLCYRDFVWFLISEEDKRHPRRSVVDKCTSILVECVSF